MEGIFFQIACIVSWDQVCILGISTVSEPHGNESLAVYQYLSNQQTRAKVLKASHTIRQNDAAASNAEEIGRHGNHTAYLVSFVKAYCH